LGRLDIQILTFLVMVGTPKKEALEQLAPMFGVPTEVLGDMPAGLAGTVDEICEDLVSRRERWGFNYVVVHEGELEAFAPVVERLAGT
jgi:hypothetical protein